MDYELQDIELLLPDGRPLFALKELRISHGSHVLIRGESGIGKTTLLHLMAGLVKPHRGQIRLGPHDYTTLSDPALCDLRRSAIGLVFQKLNLLDHLTCEENVFLALPQISPKIARRALAALQMDHRATERVAHLSLGEQQRVAVARVLASRPQIVLADEPTSSLDQTNTDLLMSALKNHLQDRTWVIVSHDHRLEPHFDRILDFKELLS